MDFMNSFEEQSSYPEVILCKFGEVILKGANRQNFESGLVKELRRRASPYGVFKIYFKQSTIYVEPQRDDCDMEGLYAAAKKVFGMFGGEETLVTLRCDASLAGVIFDRFGRDVSVMPDKDTFRVGVRVLISPQFFAWATGFGDKLVIESPQAVRSQMREFLMNAAKGYNE